jgi:hypothetical protein
MAYPQEHAHPKVSVMLPSQTVLLVENLRTKLPNDFMKTLLDGSLRVVLDDNNKIRVNLFALGMREMVRHVLTDAAPDDEVRACSWFAPIPNPGPGGSDIRRRDRMIYATQGGIPDNVLKPLGINTQGMHDTLVRTIRQLNKYTHVEPSSLVKTSAEAIALVDEVLQAVIGFLDTVASFRASVTEAIADAVNDEALNTMTENVISALDELSTHTMVEETAVEMVTVEAITAADIKQKVTGAVYVELNYGSDSDARRGDGASLSDSYPFTMLISGPVDDIHALHSGDVHVDTTSFYE